ncbi:MULTISPECIES: NlpC/P60 family protein [unclassified Ruegeria]|uniref:NlpC/P60 family protein n=1 Tax=unclassified Ruegeria TaxID=2625375 RepID=UPI00147C2A66|nr:MULTISPECIES: NlpC/P60 family protein [unclassified Ruegeria]MBO9410400.1 C40 family peptidase [Ruegeria sp. R8_1]MBO9414381.1 C40 family peptidase [Ruegeria sp. R8_2]
MSTIRDQIVAEARTWLGTPYVHQASCKGAGSDCLGLLRGVWRAVLGPEPESVPSYSMDWSEPQGDERMWQAARRHLTSKAVEDMQPGDVLLFRMRDGRVAKHVGIVSEGGEAPRFIHAYSGHGVVENTLSDPWRRRVVACFGFPLEDF